MAIDASCYQRYKIKELRLLDENRPLKTCVSINRLEWSQTIDLLEPFQPIEVPKPFRHTFNNNVSQLRGNHVENQRVFHIDELTLLPSPQQIHTQVFYEMRLIYHQQPVFGG